MSKGSVSPIQTDLDEPGVLAETHTRNSVLRERIVEHVFVGDVLRRLWRAGNVDVEVLRSEFDAGGYDLVVAFHQIVRHIQLKSSLVTSTTTEQSISLKLADKPSGCVLWVVVYPDLRFSHFLWFGGQPGEPLPSIHHFPITKHARANALGVKAERPDHRRISKGKFERLDTLESVLERLFGVSLQAS